MFIFNYVKTVCNCRFCAPNYLPIHVFSSIHNDDFKNMPCDYIKVLQYCMTKN